MLLIAGENSPVIDSNILQSDIWILFGKYLSLNISIQATSKQRDLIFNVYGEKVPYLFINIFSIVTFPYILVVHFPMFTTNCLLLILFSILLIKIFGNLNSTPDSKYIKN